MSMSINGNETGSLTYQGRMEFVKSEENSDTNCLNNGINAVDIIHINTTQAPQNSNNCVSGIRNQEEILNQILINTNRRSSSAEQAKHEESLTDAQQLSNNSHNINQQQLLNSQQTTATTSSTTPIPTLFNNSELTFDINSPTIMFSDEILDYELVFAKDYKDDDDLNEEELNTPQVIFPDRSGNNTLDNSMDPEETFQITHGNDGIIFTSTQEIIEANGIMSEDFASFRNIDMDHDMGLELFTTNNANVCDASTIKLEADPMMSENLFENVKQFPFGQKVAQQVLSLVAMKTEPTKIIENNASTARKLKNPILMLNTGLKIADDTVVTTAQVVNEVFDWETKTDAFDEISFLPSSGNLPTENDNTSSIFQYEDITQTSQFSSSNGQFDCSDYNSTAPPTPFSVTSYDTSVACSSSKSNKRRGRPPKTQSTKPDAETLENLTPSQRRYVMQRYKNNEASRQSRRNRKTKQDTQKVEEQIQAENNQYLKRVVACWEKKERLLKDMLRKQVVPV